MNAANCYVMVEWHVSPWYAHVSRALLVSEGIPAFLENEHHVALNWTLSRVLGGVRLMVPLQHQAAAVAVFALRDQGVLEAALNDAFPPEVLACGRCGGDQFVEKHRWWVVLLAIICMLKLRIIFPVKRRSSCMSCGHVVSSDKALQQM